MGDFTEGVPGACPHPPANGERSEAVARENLARYDLYRGLSPRDRETFLHYYRGGHVAMDEADYVPAYAEEEVGSTSVYGGVPDWVYLRRGLGAVVEAVETVPALQCSDHNGVRVVLRLPQSIRRACPPPLRFQRRLRAR